MVRNQSVFRLRSAEQGVQENISPAPHLQNPCTRTKCTENHGMSSNFEKYPRNLFEASHAKALGLPRDQWSPRHDLLGSGDRALDIHERRKTL